MLLLQVLPTVNLSRYKKQYKQFSILNMQYGSAK